MEFLNFLLFPRIADWDLFTLLGIGRDLVLKGLLRSTDLFVMDAQCERRLFVDWRRRVIEDLDGESSQRV